MVSSSLLSLSLSATLSRLHFVPKLSLPPALGSVRRPARRHQRPVRLSSSSSSSWRPPPPPPSGPDSGSSVSRGRRASAAGDDLVVLGIETSCDDTAAAVVRGDGKILSQVVSSQICSFYMEVLLPKWRKLLMLKLLIRLLIKH